MWRSAELTKDYKEGDKSLQLRLEDDTVSPGHGGVGVQGAAEQDWVVHGGLEFFLQIPEAAEPLASFLLLLMIMTSPLRVMSAKP